MIAIFTSVIGAAYYLRIIKFIYFYDDVFMPYYASAYYLNNSDNFDYLKNPNFTLDFIKDNNHVPMLPSDSLSLIIAILTNITLFFILKPYVLINGINIITIPLFQT
jgi:hypothetical protein